MGSPARLLLFVLLLAGTAALAEEAWQGAPLTRYIESLEQQGLRIIYSSDLVRGDYRVLEEPTAEEPAAALRQVLAPYGLTLTNGPGGSLLITRAPGAAAVVTVQRVNGAAVPGARIDVNGTHAGTTDAEGRLPLAQLTPGTHELRVRAEGHADSPPVAFTVARGAPAAVPVTLRELPPPLPEVIVTSSRYNIRYQHPGSWSFLDRDLTTRMPDVGDEPLRAINRLPGTAGGGVSTRNHVRGGTQNEQLFLFDGLRLYEPYHMKDFHEIATIVDQNAMSGMDFYSAGYQARYGDRLSGVIDIGLREPPERMETELGLSFFTTSALSRGRFGAGRGDWLVSARRANLDALVEIVNPDYGSPKYQDYLLHVGWEGRGNTLWSANGLFSHDKITIADGPGNERANARYRNDVFWLKAETAWSDRLESRSIFSATEIENRRVGTAEMPGAISGFVDDTREFRSLALKQDWELELSARWLVTSGFELKRLEADYRYDSEMTIAPPFDTILDNRPSEARNVRAAPRGSQYAAYAELRWRPSEQLTVDAGFRWDQQTYTTVSNDVQTSPRLNLLYRVGPATDLRLAWGEYYQAQEINELQVSDGLADFHPAQRAQHLVASLTHRFDAGIELRIEAYQKEYRSLVPRFENIFDPLVLIPELKWDRLRIDADAATAEGVEVTLSGGGADALSWWTSYSWSRVAESSGGETVRRAWDQPHTLSAGLNRDWGRWSISVAGSWHTGWPKTELALIDGGPTPVLAVGERNSGRYDDFHSLDFRISRAFELPRGELTAFLEVTNLYNRSNPCCTEYSLETDENGAVFLSARERYWLPIVPSLGILWRF